MSITRTDFGKTSQGQAIDLYTLTNSRGSIIKITNYGTRITEVQVADASGQLGNVVLGYDNLEQYLHDKPFFGATIGRYANRIAKGKFTLDGVEYHLPLNNAPNSLHGGVQGFCHVVWKAEPVGENKLRATYFSPNGEEGYPGNLHVAVTLGLTDDNAITLDYEATTDNATPVNVTNHSYFNLAGAGKGTVLDQEVTILSDQYTPVDDTLIPTGQIAAVRGSAFDFTTPHTIGERIAQAGMGYDHNYVLRSAGKLALAATVHDPMTGRTMDVLTTQPGIQFYSGNFLDGSIRGNGGVYVRHGALCLETQHFPDSPNQPNFPSTILKPGQTFRESTVYRFRTK